MRVIIVPDDGVVLIDGKGRVVDCSSVDRTIHAVQWYDDHGEIEYKTFDGVRAPNLAITDLSLFQIVIDAWRVVPDRIPVPYFLESETVNAPS